ncbi:MAG: murein biosynthesis integral membrane protein MurJ [Tissierella sp.]|uniref:murein biosynthesis integral membrane protein MurJ n=1 Tax=Tissierella sp. TaxID=41274 RepID=UPI003F9BE014
MKKTAILLMFITIISKIMGFAREISLSYFYGATNISDAYIISITIPSVIFALVGAAISTGFIPMYSSIEKDYGDKEAKKYTNNLINIIVVICTIIVSFVLIFTEPVVKLFAAGFTGDTLALAIRFTKISIVGIYFTAIIAVLTAFLQIKDNFAIPALIGIPMNVIVIFSLFLSSRTDIIVLAIGTVLATISQLIFLLPYIKKAGYKYKAFIDIKDKHIKNMALIVIPVIIGVSVTQINVLVDRSIASNVVIGGISALNYANRLNGFVQGLFVVSISTVMYPMISKMAAEKDMNGLEASIIEAINSISILVIPTTIGAMVFSGPIVKLLFGRGAFDPSALDMTSTALFFYAIGMLGAGLRQVLSRGFYALKDSKTPMINGVIAVSINIILNIILSRFLGIGGLALATSISGILGSTLLILSLRKRLNGFSFRKIFYSWIKLIAASLAMGLVAKLAFNFLLGAVGESISLIVSIGVGAAVYLAILPFLKLEEVDSLIAIVKQKIGR